MSGAGKSAIAAPLARLLGGEVVDVDALIEVKIGESLPELLAKRGDEEFLRIESEVIRALNPKPDSIIATGGSAVLIPEAMEHLRKISRIVYLAVPFKTIECRRGTGAESSIVGIGSKTLQEIYDERLPLYKKYADVVVDAASGSSRDVAERVRAAVIKN